MSKRHGGLWSSVVLLGLTTIGAYGVAYYSIGVLIPAIAEDTGWRAGSLATAFSLGLLLQGGVALGLGRLFDRWGSALAFGASLGIGAPLLFVASFAAEPWQFILAWTVGSASIGGGLYYNVTMPALGRLFPETPRNGALRPDAAGRLREPDLLPARRRPDRIDGLAKHPARPRRPPRRHGAACRAPGAGARWRAPRESVSTRGSLAIALRAPPVYRALVVVALAAFANSAVMLHQISIMEATGLSLAAASSYAGLKGFCQLPGPCHPVALSFVS